MESCLHCMLSEKNCFLLDAAYDIRGVLVHEYFCEDSSNDDIRCNEVMKTFQMGIHQKLFVIHRKNVKISSPPPWAMTNLFWTWLQWYHDELSTRYRRLYRPTSYYLQRVCLIRVGDISSTKFVSICCKINGANYVCTQNKYLLNSMGKLLPA